MNPSTFTLNFSPADSPVAQFSFERSGFDTAGFWVRVDSGDWTPAVGLLPPNGSGSGIGWSSEFVQSLLRFGGVETLSAVNTYTLDVAFGTAGALDAYDAANAACQMTLSVYVATLPETGGNTTVPLELAILFTLAGTVFIGLGRRRRTA
jgi:LPXTG-motif cell wall-anchored protein